MSKQKNKSAPDKSARFDFNKAARKAVKDHPELKGRVMYVDAVTEEFDDVEFKLIKKDVYEDDIEELRKTFKAARRGKTSFTQSVEIGNKEVSVVVFYPDKYPVYGGAYGPEDDAGTFDHETGHALNKKLEGTLSEATADSYAALRNLQRFGNKTDDIRYAGWKRAAVFMLTGMTSHLTTFAIDKIAVDTKTADFLSLSPADTAEIARHYAKANTPDKAQLEKLKTAFKSVAKKKLSAALNEIALITLKAEAKSDTFYLGARVMLGALQPGGVDLDGQHIELQGKTWDKVKDEIDHKIATLHASHPLRHL